VTVRHELGRAGAVHATMSVPRRPRHLVGLERSAALAGPASPGPAAPGPAFDFGSIPVTPNGPTLRRSALSPEAAAPSRLDPYAQAALATAAGDPGSPLPAELGRTFGRSLGADLSDVRIHQGHGARAAAAAVGARAFTVGRDIHFGAGEFAPGTQRGRELIAHEVVHALHHRPATTGSPTVLSAPGDPSERHAAETAHRLVSAAPRSRHPVAGRSPVAGGPVTVHRAGDPYQAEASRVGRELENLIAVASWRKIRPRLYPGESAAGIARSRARHTGARSEMTGLGANLVLDRFATRVRDIQGRWAGMSVDGRLRALAAAASAELVAARVPALLAVVPIVTESKALFDQESWSIEISRELVTSSELSNVDAAEVANTTLHESRHAEQAFLGARSAAGPSQNLDATALHAQLGIPVPVAQQAVAERFTAQTDPATRDLGRQMFDDFRRGSPTGERERAAVETADVLNAKRVLASEALRKLRAAPSPETIEGARRAIEDLKRQIQVVEAAYHDYRQIPSEADAHEVGDAEGEAFQGWPGTAAPSPGGHRHRLPPELTETSPEPTR